MSWYGIHASAVSKSAVVTSAPCPVRSRSRSAATTARAAHIPVPMSTIEVPARAGAWPGCPVSRMNPVYPCIIGS